MKPAKCSNIFYLKAKSKIHLKLRYLRYFYIWKNKIHISLLTISKLCFKDRILRLLKTKINISHVLHKQSNYSYCIYWYRILKSTQLTRHLTRIHISSQLLEIQLYFSLLQHFSQLHVIKRHFDTWRCSTRILVPSIKFLQRNLAEWSTKTIQHQNSQTRISIYLQWRANCTLLLRLRAKVVAKLHYLIFCSRRVLYIKFKFVLVKYSKSSVKSINYIISICFSNWSSKVAIKVAVHSLILHFFNKCHKLALLCNINEGKVFLRYLSYEVVRKSKCISFLSSIRSSSRCISRLFIYVSKLIHLQEYSKIYKAMQVNNAVKLISSSISELRVMQSNFLVKKYRSRWNLVFATRKNKLNSRYFCNTITRMIG
eukprot:NODE_551_length_6816_cov_0.293881.p2 type:complete len:370 gc:universal NODE_551_length_6816_cov_0.293881:2526-1417(-)